jgi:hypothetical protein
MLQRIASAAVIAAALLLTGACGQSQAAAPAQAPTVAPTAAPASAPTNVPTIVPTAAPTSAPTNVPTIVPTAAPTSAPTTAPTVVPTAAPTQAPTATATDPCAAVEHLDPASRAARAIGAAYVRSLPPDRDVGQIERIYGVDRLGAWVVFEASFIQTEPGVSVLRREGTGYREIASWGGPVQHAHELQDYLSAQAPDAPQALLTCLRPKQAHFTYHQP